MKIEQLAYERGYTMDDEGNMYRPNGKQIKGCISNTGYRTTKITKKDRLDFHRFMAFLKFKELMYEKSIQVRHLDGIRSNNSKSNIEIGTPQQNMMDKKPEVRFRAAKNAARVLRKLTDEEVISLRKDRELGLRYIDLMGKYHINSKSTIAYIVNRQTYSEIK